MATLVTVIEWVSALKQLVGVLEPLGRELAQAEGLDPAEFDRRVAEAEQQRGASVSGVLNRLRGMLGQA